MFVVICYDISNTRRRARVHKTLKAYGENVQKSVFECILTDTQWAQMQVQLLVLLQPPDRLRFYPLCSACRARVSGTPAHPTATRPSHLVI